MAIKKTKAAQIKELRAKNKKLLIESEKTLKPIGKLLKMGKRKEAQKRYDAAVKINERRNKINDKIIKLTKSK